MAGGENRAVFDPHGGQSALRRSGVWKQPQPQSSTPGRGNQQTLDVVDCHYCTHLGAPQFSLRESGFG
jgi:hypothetical protein